MLGKGQPQDIEETKDTAKELDVRVFVEQSSTSSSQTQTERTAKKTRNRLPWEERLMEWVCEIQTARHKKQGSTKAMHKWTNAQRKQYRL